MFGRLKGYPRQTTNKHYAVLHQLDASEIEKTFVVVASYNSLCADPRQYVASLHQVRCQKVGFHNYLLLAGSFLFRGQRVWRAEHRILDLVDRLTAVDL